MKTDFDIRVHVDLGVTPELVALVNAIIGQKQMPVVQQPSASEQPLREAQSPALPVPSEEPGREEVPAEHASEVPSEEPAPEVEEQADASAVENGPKELTEEDIREAMHRTRQRIEGENYKDETDSEAYKKYHRQLTSQFKNIAAELGADKPSALPADKREQFIRECDELTAGEDGVIIRIPF